MGMSNDTSSVSIIDIVNNIRDEIRSNILQLKELQVASDINCNEHGIIRGPAAVLVTKVNMLETLMRTTQSCAAFVNIDKRIVAMGVSGQNLRNALIELAPKDEKAREYVGTLIKDWDDNSIRAM